MRLEYEIATTGRGRFVRDLRTIEQELDRSARRGVGRDQKTEQGRIRLREVSAKRRLSTDESMVRRAAAAEERTAKASAAARIREEKRVAAEHARQLRWRQNLQNRYWSQHALQRRRDEMAEVRSQQRMARAAVTTRAKTSARFGAGTARAATGTLGLLGGGIRAVGGLVGLGGGLAAGMAAGSQMDESLRAAQLANQAGDPSLKKGLLKEAQSIKGFSGQEAMDGLGAFVEKTGDLDAGRQLLQRISNVALATNTNLEDLGRTAGQAFNVLADQMGPQEAIEETASIIRTLAQMGNLGSIEVSDLAKSFGKLGAATRAFEGDAPDLLRTVGAFAQMAVAKGGAEPADASTAASRLASDIITNRKKFEKILGPDSLKSETDPRKLRDPLEIMLDVLNKTGGDVMKTGGLFGNESVKIFRGLAATFAEGEKDGTGGGEKAVRNEFERFAGATMTDEQEQERVQSVLDEPSMKLKEAFKELRISVGEKLVPVISKLTPKIVEAIPHIGNFIDKLIAFGKAVAPLIEKVGGMVMTLIENDPFDGMGVLVGGLLVRQFGGSIISSIVSSGVEKLMAVIAARAAGGALAGSVPLPGGGAAGGAAAGGTAAKVGRVGSIVGRAAPALGLAGMIGGALVGGLGIGYLGGELYNNSEMGKKKNLENALAEQEFHGIGVYDGAGKKNRDWARSNGTAGFDTQTRDSIQKNFMPGDAAATQGQGDNGEAFLKAAEKLLEVADKNAQSTKGLEAAMRNVANMPGRTNPILSRGG